MESEADSNARAGSTKQFQNPIDFLIDELVDKEKDS
jgi:hypothetical protein